MAGDRSGTQGPGNPASARRPTRRSAGDKFPAWAPVRQTPKPLSNLGSVWTKGTAFSCAVKVRDVEAFRPVMFFLSFYRTPLFRSLFRR